MQSGLLIESRVDIQTASVYKEVAVAPVTGASGAKNENVKSNNTV